MILAGKKIVVASGPTSAPIDDVRILTNRSSGRLGSSITHALAKEGARVVQLCGTPSVSVQDMVSDDAASSVSIQRYETVDELRSRIQETLQSCPDAFLMASAVLDYIPAEPVQGKKSSSENEWIIRLVRNEKLIENIRIWSPDTLLVGFKLESQISQSDLIGRAVDLATRSRAAMVVANRLQDINDSEHTAVLVEPRPGDSPWVSEALQSRERIAARLVERLAHHLGEETRA